MSLFDGMAGIVRDVMGEAVTIAPIGADPITVMAVFRETPVFFDGAEGGQIPGNQPELICAPEVADLIRNGARVKPPNGKTYAYYAAVNDTANPAPDHNVRVLLVLT